MGVVKKPMTSADLMAELEGIGITRSARTLESWRSKGLLPPMTRKGQGRGSGARWFWEGDVVDQAVAADYLLSVYRRTDVVVYGLWVSGFDVAPEAVRKNWLNLIERDETAVRREVTRSNRDFFGLGKSQWKKMLRESDPLSLRQFVIKLLVGEKLSGDPAEESDYRQRLAEAIVDSFPLPESEPVLPGHTVDVFASDLAGAFSACVFR